MRVRRAGRCRGGVRPGIVGHRIGKLVNQLGGEVEGFAGDDGARPHFGDRQRGAIPEYRITASGPDHAKRFDAQVFLVGELLGEGTGRSKKEAEQAAAKRALPKLQ